MTEVLADRIRPVCSVYAVNAPWDIETKPARAKSGAPVLTFVNNLIFAYRSWGGGIAYGDPVSFEGLPLNEHDQLVLKRINFDRKYAVLFLNG
ncbi:hypothetical protein D3C76_1702980 [compost metagenome]